MERGDGEEEVGAAEAFAVCEFLCARQVESAMLEREYFDCGRVRTTALK